MNLLRLCILCIVIITLLEQHSSLGAECPFYSSGSFNTEAPLSTTVAVAMSGDLAIVQQNYQDLNQQIDFFFNRINDTLWNIDYNYILTNGTGHGIALGSGLAMYDDYSAFAPTEWLLNYQYNGSNWNSGPNILGPLITERGIILCLWGQSAAMYDTTLVVTCQAQTTGPSYLFIYERLMNGSYILDVNITDPYWSIGDSFGNSVDIYNDTIIVGSPTANNSLNVTVGAFSIYQKINNVWNFVERFEPSSTLDGEVGYSVTIEKNVAVVGAPQLSYAYVYYGTYNESGVLQWSIIQTLVALTNDGFGSSVSMSNGLLLVGAPSAAGSRTSSGYTELYEYISQGSGFTSIQILTGNVTDFGAMVALSNPPGTQMCSIIGSDTSDILYIWCQQSSDICGVCGGNGSSCATTGTTGTTGILTTTGHVSTSGGTISANYSNPVFIFIWMLVALMVTIVVAFIGLTIVGITGRLVPVSNSRSSIKHNKKPTKTKHINEKIMESKYDK